ncbi:hypothetical protein [Vibrio marisflavi]|uniref:Uncharacterized protein n=1 Tax=Vibrio marisflavi CECT 7928 TaxID=634439 RepID=A0ABM9A3C8_9VIBR|nr:hypothetical protein [Vibrio marisflavi]CAH0538549.1 hypothetical protein VMF7928_01471 [Vibrio marisflavi CECT 7928]
MSGDIAGQSGKVGPGDWKGIELTTANEISYSASSSVELITGNKTSFVVGNYLSTAGPFTNKVYGGEYVQYYPGIKTDIIYWTEKVQCNSRVITAAKDHYYLRKLKAVQSEVTVAQDKLDTAQSNFEVAENDFSAVDFRAYFDNLETVTTNLRLAESNLEAVKNNAVSKQSKLVSEISTSKLDQVSARLVSGDVTVDNNKLKML